MPQSEPRRTFAASVALPEAQLPEAPRRELRRGTTGVDLEASGVRFRVGDLPLFRSAAGGGLEQCVRIVVSADRDVGRVRFRIDQAEATVELRAGEQSVRLFVSEVHEQTTRTLAIDGPEGVGLRHVFEIRPQRKWRIFLIQQTHLDIGYTDPQALLLSHHLAYLDSTLDFAAETAEWVEPARFRWNVEANWPLERWLSSRPAAMREELLGRIREGRIEVCALPFTMHAEAASLDELARQLRFSDALGDRTGVPIVTAMQTDVPGAPAALVNLLADAGVRYLSVAHNYAGRAAPHLTSGQELTRPFYWRSESGKRVLVWYTDSPHGVAYLEGNLLGLAESYDSSLELVPEYLAALATRPYPYGQGIKVFGVPPELELTRPPYPHDLLHLRVQGTTADNAAPSIVPAEVVRAWCSEWAYPELRLATNAEFFAEAEARLGSELETYTGDWTDWWADGLGSAAQALGANRRAQATIRSAQTLHTLADALAGPADDWPLEVDRAYQSMSLFDEHTWGAAQPGGDDLVGRSSGAEQWQAKQALARDAHDRSAALLESATSRLAQLVGGAPAALASLAVFNPSSWPRTDVVRVFVPTSRVPLDRSFAVLAADAVQVPHAEEPQSGPANRNRPQGRWVTLVADDVPPLGYRRYTLVDGSAPPQGSPDDYDVLLENEHYRVEFDSIEGCAVSIFDKALDRELVDADSPFGFGQYVHDRYTSTLRATARPPASGVTTNAAVYDGRVPEAADALLFSRSTAGHGVIVDRISNPVEERLAFRLVAEGADRLETTYRLWHGIGRLEIEQRLAKLATTEKESVYFVFPLAADEPEVEFELTGAVGGQAAPKVPGSAEHLAVLRHWISLHDSAGTVVWAADEPALAHLGNIHLPYPPYPTTVEPSRPGTIVSWAMNNVWDTNFPLVQGGEATFRYALASAAPATDGRQLGRATAASLTRPLVGVLGAARGRGGLRDFGSFCVLDRDDVEVILLGASQRGHSLAVHLHSTARTEVEVSIAFPDLEIERVFAGTFLERQLADVTHAGGARVRIGPGDYVALAVDLAG